MRTLYGRKANILLLPLDVCLLQTVDGKEEFRPSPESNRLIAAPIQDERDGRIGLIAQYTWPPREGMPVDPVVMVQMAPSATLRGVEDLRVIASQAEVGDTVVCVEGNIEGKVMRSICLCTYPDLTHQVNAYHVEFPQHVGSRAHGSAVRFKSGQLLGMLIATMNLNTGVCRALVYPT